MGESKHGGELDPLTALRFFCESCLAPFLCPGPWPVDQSWGTQTRARLRERFCGPAAFPHSATRSVAVLGTRIQVRVTRLRLRVWRGPAHSLFLSLPPFLRPWTLCPPRPLRLCLRALLCALVKIKNIHNFLGASIQGTRATHLF